MTTRPRLRIAVLSYGLPARAHKRGGIERAAHTLADGLARRGHEVVVLSHDPRPAGAVYAVAPLPWRTFVETWLGRRVTMGYLGNLLALVPDYREFDAVIAHGDSLLLPLAGKPVVRVMHGSALGEARSAASIGRRVLQLGVFAQELLTALLSRGVVGVSENTRRDNPFVRRVIPHGVDDRFFSASDAGKSRTPSVLFVGTLDGRKRGRFLLDLFQHTVRAAHPEATLDFVGPPGPAQPGVTYHTGISDDQLANLYRRAWVYASPSTYEGFGLPYLEAMACGTPVVASSNPGSREVLDDGRCGMIATDASFAGELTAILGDAPRRAALAAQGLCRAREYSLSRMVGEYEELLYELTEVHAGSPLASDALAYDPLAWAGPADAVDGDRWGWVEIFLAIQLLWGAALFIPGAQAFRTPVRALPYLASAAALVYYFRMPTGEPLHSSARWLMASFGLLTLNLLHATTHSMAGVAQIVFQISIAAPIFWMARAVRTDRRVMRMMWLLFGASFISSALGILQVYYPGTFLPPEFSTLGRELNPEIISSLTYHGADGREIIRPPGLSDMPGGAAVSAMVTVTLGLALAFRRGLPAMRRVACAAGATIGMTALLLTQVRSLSLVAAASLGVFAALRLRQGRATDALASLAVGAALVTGAFVWAVAVGGDALMDRFSGLVDNGVIHTFREQRGAFLTYTLSELLYQFPLGAGLGRWGMMQVYFGDPTLWQAPPIHVEIQPTGWLLDGGVALWVAMGGALVMAVRTSYLVAVHATGTLQDAATAIVCLQLTVLCLCLTGPVFNTQLGIQFWAVTGAVLGPLLAAPERDLAEDRDG